MSRPHALNVAVRTLACVVLLLVSALNALTQDSATGAIRASVEAPSGARIAGAHVVLTDSARGVAREALSDESGVAHFSLLPPGEYSLRVTSSGMAPLVPEAI